MNMDKFYEKRHHCPVALRLLPVLCVGKVDILCWRRALPCVMAGGPALYKMTPAVGESSPLPHSLAPQPLAFLLLLLSEAFAKHGLILLL